MNFQVDISNRINNFLGFKDELGEIVKDVQSNESAAARRKFLRAGISFIGRAVADFLRGSVSGIGVLATRGHNKCLNQTSKTYWKAVAADVLHITTCALGILAPHTVANSQKDNGSLRARADKWVMENYMHRLAHEAVKPVRATIQNEFDRATEDVREEMASQGIEVESLIQRLEATIQKSLSQYLIENHAWEKEPDSTEERCFLFSPDYLRFRSFTPYMTVEQEVRTDLVEERRIKGGVKCTECDLLAQAITEELGRALSRSTQQLPRITNLSLREQVYKSERKRLLEIEGPSYWDGIAPELPSGRYNEV